MRQNAPQSRLRAERGIYATGQHPTCGRKEMQMTNSRQKGAAGERELAKLCRAEGYDVHRTAQYRGNTGAAGDCEGLPGIHIECKRCQQVRLEDWMAQAVRDSEASGEGNLPVVFHRKNNCDWLVTMRISDWFAIYREWEMGRCETQQKTGTCAAEA